MQRCDICSKSFANRQNLNRHRTKIHGMKKNEHELFCSSCDFNYKTLIKMQVHLSSQHNGKPTRICVYCKKIFMTESNFRKHLREQHSLPMRNQTDKIDDRNFNSAFNNTFKIFKIEAEDDHNLLEFLLEKETLIQETLMENSQRKLKKVQLSVKLILQKPIEEDTDKIEVHLNTDMNRVFAQGLAKETFFEMIDKLLSTLFSFRAHGSGWIVDEMKTVELKMANFAPVRGSSYLALPSELQGVWSLLNIRNHLDKKFFLYCFTAAYYLFYGPPLQTDTWRTVTSPPLYSSNNFSAHQAKGDFDMPMGFKDMPKFEILNDVQEMFSDMRTNSCSRCVYQKITTLSSRWTFFFYMTIKSIIMLSLQTY